MAVDTLHEFPAFFTAGDTLRIEISDGDFPSDEWTLQVLFSGPSRKTITAAIGDDDTFELVVDAGDSAKLSSGLYDVVFIFTETDGGERKSKTFGKVMVLPDPATVSPKTTARRTLEAMELAYEKLAGGSNLIVNFNGQSFTKKNLKEFQDAIARQRAVVANETADVDLYSGTRAVSGIGVRFA